MRNWLNILISSIVVMVGVYITPGIHVDGLYTAIFLAALFALANVSISPLLKLLTLPPDVLNLWLISVVINVLMVYLIDRYNDGFTVTGFSAALIFSFVLSLVGTGFTIEIKKRAFR